MHSLLLISSLLTTTLPTQSGIAAPKPVPPPKMVVGPMVTFENTGKRFVSVRAFSETVRLPAGAKQSVRLWPEVTGVSRYPLNLRNDKDEVLGRVRFDGKSLIAAKDRGVQITIQDREMLVVFGSRRQRIRLLK